MNDAATRAVRSRREFIVEASALTATLAACVRFYVVNAGPTHPCAFHVVGAQFDTVYLGAPPGNAIRGVQTFGVAAAAE